MLVDGVSSPHVSTHISSTHVPPVMSLNFTYSTPASLITRIISTPIPMIPTTSVSNVVVNGIPSVPFRSSPLFQKILEQP